VHKETQGKTWPQETIEEDGTKVAPASAIVPLYLEKYREWKTRQDKNQKVMGLMRLNVSSGLRMKLKGCDSSKQIWDKLAQLHQIDDENDRADKEGRIPTLRKGDDPVKFLEKYSTMLQMINTLILLQW
jgi:hypothetical protein